MRNPDRPISSGRMKMGERVGVVLYDALYVRGGAERVTYGLARGLGADLVCAFRDAEVFPDSEFDGQSLRVLGRGVRHPVLRQLRGMSLFYRQASFLGNYEWAVYSGSTAPLAVRHHRGGRNIYYCHALPRFVYDLRDYYLGRVPAWQRPLLHALIGYVRPRFEDAMTRMDRIIANSENVRGRIQRYLGRDAEVVYPPCDVQAYRWLEAGDYFLSTARLEPYKQVDLVVEAFRRLPKERLVVASGGSDEQRLRRLAADAANIEFVGWQSDEQLRELVGRCRATIYIPRDEDFGMSPVESMAAGKPVIGVAEGGVLESVLDGETGVLIARDPNAEAVAAAVAHMSPALARSWRFACESRAQRFSVERFRARMRQLISRCGSCF